MSEKRQSINRIDSNIKTSRMFQKLSKSYFLNPNIAANVRTLTTTEVSTALRPFYFAVHPDLFGQYPNERAINENSLKQLSSIIECLQSKKVTRPIILPFYIKEKYKEGTFRSIKIHIKGPDLRETVTTILKSCELSTEFVDNIPKPLAPVYHPQIIKINPDIDFSKVSENDPIFGQYIMNRKIKESQDSFKLRNWLGKNCKLALEKNNLRKPLSEEVNRLQQLITEKLQLLEIRWNCGWNETHFRGCLQSFLALIDQHPEVVHLVKGRVLVFAPFTGISLDGHIMLNSGEVRHNWLDLIKNVNKYDAVLGRIPNFEKTVSQVLRNIKVGRRKFMFKILAGEYERNLLRITTSLSDYLSYRKFPEDWPDSLEQFEIVVENDAGPLMVSPTGQFIVPCSLPGSLLVNFITANMEEAKRNATKYKHDKYTERFLQKKCREDFQLEEFHKDDNVTPEMMIKCCERLLENEREISVYLQGICLNIATYYSVLSDGVACIPWNWKL